MSRNERVSAPVIAPSFRPAGQVTFLERVSSRYLRSSHEAAPTAPDPIHVLNADERAGLRRVVRGAQIRAALAGTANAIVTGLGELYASRFLGHRPAHATFRQTVSYWGIFGLLAAIFAVAEIAFLYFDALRSVHRLSLVAGLELHRDENADVATALARAALELPHPPDATLGVDPHREANKLQLAFASVFYKAKISVTNFLFKALVTRGLGRAATRGVLAFTAIPINAAWNVLVCRAVMREARICVMGPSAAEELLMAAFSVDEPPSAALVDVTHQALGGAVVRTRLLHPNHAALIRAFRRRFGEPSAALAQDDTRDFLAAIPRLLPEERRVVLWVLSAAAVLDGRLVRNERRLLRESYAAAGISPRLGEVERLCRAFVAGDPIDKNDVRRTA
jgi:hypothetical protein